VSPPGWGWLQQHVQKLKGSWVRFHIINQYLGGPGNKTWNLVPTSVAVNNAFCNGIEQAAKKSALTDDHWTYVDVKLTYDSDWPAPIPKSISSAEWGDWDDNGKKWVCQKTLPGALLNPDITDLGGVVYRRGINIRLKDIIDRKVPKLQQGPFKEWLQEYRQTGEDIREFEEAAEAKFGDEIYDGDGWLNAIYLDEDDDHPGKYVPVVKAL